MKYRSRTDIASQLLEAANGGASKTKIMYRAYLSFAQLRQYLTMLIESGLIEYQPNQREYKTTEKGLRFLKAYKEIGYMVSPNSSELPKP
jgi:predicted transcriptional regulator